MYDPHTLSAVPASDVHKSSECKTSDVANSLEVVVINLKRAVERREQIMQQFSGFKIPWSFFEAHTSLANSDLYYDEAEFSQKYGEPLSAAQLAVWSSHFTVIQNFLKHSKRDYLLVFEDDVIYDTAFPLRKLVELCAARDIHYIRLFGMMDTKAKWQSCFFDRWIIRYQSGPCGAQAYLVSKEGAKRLTESMRVIDAAVDVSMDRFWKTKLPIYSVFPFPVIERFSPSTIPIHEDKGPNQSQWRSRFPERLRNKIGRAMANLDLASRDREIQKAGWSFKQVDVGDLE